MGRVGTNVNTWGGTTVDSRRPGAQSDMSDTSFSEPPPDPSSGRSRAGDGSLKLGKGLTAGSANTRHTVLNSV